MHEIYWSFYSQYLERSAAKMERHLTLEGIVDLLNRGRDRMRKESLSPHTAACVRT